MREIRTSGLMSGEGRRVVQTIPRLSSTLLSLCLCVSGASPKGALTLWVEVPPGQWSVGPVAGRRLGWVTDRVEALRQRPLLAAERIDGP
jgi:hypothetical protein